VTAVAASSRGDDVVISCDERGQLRLWDLPSFTPKGRAEDKERGVLEAGSEVGGDPCTALELLGSDLAVAGFASGHVRLYEIASQFAKVAELQAHTRCVTGLAIDEEGLELATVSEDSYLHVWSLEAENGGDAAAADGGGEAKGGEAKAPGDDRSLALNYSAYVADALLTGVQFVAAAPGAFRGNAAKTTDLAVTAYDVDALSVWTRE